jgi:hypothetical protein
MAEIPNEKATGNFEFEALRWASNYRQALIAEFAEHLRGQVIEVGAGIGQMTELVAGVPGVRGVLAVEPDANFNREFRRRLPQNPLVPGTVADVQPGSPCQAIVSVNVLEHIGEDERELAAYARLLHKERGCVCLFVPARPEIYAPLDKDFGHYRRYTKPELRSKLERAGFEIVRLNYFNCVGYFAWWLNFCVFKKRRFDVASVRFFDGVIFPVTHALESKILRPPFGQSLLAIGRAAPK